MSTAIVLYLLNTIIRGAAAALIIVTLEAVGRRKLVFARGRIVYGVLLLAIFFPFEYLVNSSNAPEWREAKSWRHIQVEPTAMDFNFNLFPADQAEVAGAHAGIQETAPASVRFWNWSFLILAACGIVAAFLSAKQICLYCIWRGRIRKCIAITSGRVFDVFRESKRLAGMANMPVTLLDGGGLLPTAACYGTQFGGAILCPLAECEQYSCLQLKMILIHELGHLRKYDNPTAFFLIFLGKLFFMNPFLRIIINRWLLIAELDCDEKVRHLLKLDKAGVGGYAGLLLDFQQRTVPPPGAGAYLSTSARNLKLRIRELAMKRTKLELAGIFAGIIGIFCLSMLIVPELSAVPPEKGAVTLFDVSRLADLPSNRLETIYINGTLIDDAGLALLQQLEASGKKPPPGQQVVDMILLAGRSRAVSYSGIVRSRDGNGSGGYTIVQSAQPGTMELYQQYDRDKYGKAMEIKKLNQDSFAAYVPGLPYEFDPAQNSVIAINSDDVFCMYDSNGRRQAVIRREDRQYTLSIWPLLSAPNEAEAKNRAIASLQEFVSPDDDTGAMADYLDQFATIEILGRSGEQFDLQMKLVINDRLVELVKLCLANERRLVSQYRPVLEVAATSPLNGATGVDPATAAITVTFNQPMRRSYSFCRTGDDFPETPETPSYNADCTTISLPVKLEPNKTYNLYLNRGQYLGFVSAGGKVLNEYHYTFTTGDRQ